MKAKVLGLFVVLFNGIAAVLLLYLAFGLFVSPKPVTFKVALPDGADVYPSEKVQPGTFKIEVPFAELNTRTTNSSFPALVAFGGSPGQWLPAATVQAWLPRGDNTFYHARLRTPGGVEDWFPGQPHGAPWKPIHGNPGNQQRAAGRGFSGGLHLPDPFLPVPSLSRPSSPGHIAGHLTARSFSVFPSRFSAASCSRALHAPRLSAAFSFLANPCSN